MANSTTNLDLISASQASKEVSANAMFDAASPAMLYGRRAGTTAALTWGYYGGNVSISGAPTPVANSTVTLAASATNYIEADPTTGAVAVNQTGFTAGHTPLYSVVTGASTVTSYTDCRVLGGGGVSPTSILGSVNVFTKNQSVAPVSLSGVSPAIDASLSNNFKMTLTANNTLVNPTNLTEGMILNFAIDQDATGGRTLSFGSLYKFPGSVAPTLSTAANAKDFMSCYYDGSILRCQLNKAYG